MEAKGLLFDGSPVRVRSDHLLAIARSEGKPLMKGNEVSTQESLSPNSVYVSHRSSSLQRVDRLAEADDVDGLLQCLDKPDLSAVEKVVKILALKIKSVADTQASSHKILQLEQAIMKTGTSPLVMCFECLKQVESSMGRLLNDQTRGCAPSLRDAAGGIIKAFQRKKAAATVYKKIGGADANVLSKVGFGLFAAALCHFARHFASYQAEDGSSFTKESAKLIVRPLLQVYSDVMKAYVTSLPNASPTLVEVATSVSSIEEWYHFCKMRVQRDHKGGHCAAWTEGHAGEGERLNHVKDLFARMVEADSEELRGFPTLKQFVVPHMEQYIAGKEAHNAKKRPFSDLSSEDSDSNAVDWASW